MRRIARQLLLLPPPKPLPLIFPLVNVLPEQVSSKTVPTASWDAASLMLALAMLVSAPMPRRLSVTIPSALPEPASSSLVRTASVAAARTTPAARASLSVLLPLLSDLTTPPSALPVPVSSSPAPTASEAAARAMPAVTRGAPTTRPVPTSLLSPSRLRLALTEPALPELVSSRSALTASRDAARRMLVVRTDLSAPSKRWNHFHYVKPCE